jgi:hypothetical protein
LNIIKRRLKVIYFKIVRLEREIDNNVSVKDHDVMKDIFENGVCNICNQYFDIRSDDVQITPTLGRINNKVRHSLSKYKPC